MTTIATGAADNQNVGDIVFDAAGTYAYVGTSSITGGPIGNLWAISVPGGLFESSTLVEGQPYGLAICPPLTNTTTSLPPTTTTTTT